MLTSRERHSCIRCELCCFSKALQRCCKAVKQRSYLFRHWFGLTVPYIKCSVPNNTANLQLLTESIRKVGMKRKGFSNPPKEKDILHSSFFKMYMSYKWIWKLVLNIFWLVKKINTECFLLTCHYKYKLNYSYCWHW